MARTRERTKAERGDSDCPSSRGSELAVSLAWLLAQLPFLGVLMGWSLLGKAAQLSHRWTSGMVPAGVHSAARPNRESGLRKSNYETTAPSFNHPSHSMKPVILIADDDEAVRSMLGRFLESEGLNVVFAKNGTQALFEFLIRPYDLALLDLKMPGPDGWEVFDALSALPGFQAMSMNIAPGPIRAPPDSRVLYEPRVAPQTESSQACRDCGLPEENDSSRG
jgi:CheY-like chemotaxis protein